MFKSRVKIRRIVGRSRPVSVFVREIKRKPNVIIIQIITKNNVW